MHRQMDGWTDKWMNGWTDGWAADQGETFVNEMLASFKHHHHSSLNSVTKELGCRRCLFTVNKRSSPKDLDLAFEKHFI